MAVGFGSYSCFWDTLCLADDGSHFLMALLVDPPDEGVEHVMGHLWHREKRNQEDKCRSLKLDMKSTEELRMLPPDEPIPYTLFEKGQRKEREDINGQVFNLEE